MSSKEEIKVLFIAEIKNTPEYQIVLQMKAFILNEIATPNIQEELIYYFGASLNKQQLKNIQLSMIVEFGFYTNNMTGECIFIDMRKFLE